MAHGSHRWEPRPRPAWVSVMNRFGDDRGTPASIVSLDERSLLDAARAATGLDDFGDDGWREPFELLRSDLDEVAELHLVGRLLARADLLRSLIVRLQMAEAEKRHPEILEQDVGAPILITGMGRTGTSILFELLDQDPQLRAPQAWELRHPATLDRPVGEVDPRVALAASEWELWLEVVPEFLAIHEVHPDGPDEDSSGQIHEFTSPVWAATHHAPNYEAWLHGSDMAQAFRFHRRMLQHLQWQRPAGQWLCKAPAHLSALPTFFAEYPDARVIMTHRDPIKVLPSTAHMLATLRWQRSDRVDHDEIARTIGLGYPLLLDIVIDQRNSGAVPDDRFVDVRFADLMADHLGTIGAVYERLGLELTDEAAGRMRAYLDARPQGRHGDAGYRFEQLGIDEAETREQLARYMERFGVPREQA